MAPGKGTNGGRIGRRRRIETRNGSGCKKGFTLIEIIVVLAILVIAATLGITSLRNFTVHSEQRARDQVARTIFMAAQTALTQKYNQDRNFYQNDKSPVIPDINTIRPALSTAERAKEGKLVYLVVNPGEASGKLFDWLDPQMNDKEVLNQAILVEYNKETGRVLSAFYSEKVIDGEHVKLSYDGAYNVHARGESARAAGFVGYYGVDGTGEPIRNNPIDANNYSIILRDYTAYSVTGGAPYGVLTAEIELPRADLREASFFYTLTLMPAEGTNETLTFTDAPELNADFRLTADLLQYTSIQEAMENPHLLNGRRVVSYYDEGAGKLVIVLDCVQSYGAYSATENLGIRTNYPGIRGGYLDASLEISDGADTVVLYSDDTGEPRVHALYGDMSDDTGRTVYSVVSVRHLNNIRYNTEKNAVFTQKADLHLCNYKGDRLNFTPLCNALDPARADADDPDSYGFLGAYQNPGYQYKIYDLWVDLTVANTMNLLNAGLFDTVYGSVSGVRFATTDTDGLIIPTGDATQTGRVKGIRSAGGIAGVNKGGITNCTVLGEISASGQNDSIAGGIAGGNEAGGTIRGCYVAAQVTASRYAGGIAGSSAGTIAGCEVGTASWRLSTDPSRLYMSGVPYFGAHAEASSYLLRKTANNTFRIIIERDNGAAGGIAGALLYDGTVSDCVNAAKIEAGNEIDGEGAHVGGTAGGIVGYVNATDMVQTAVKCCYNAGAVYATTSAGGLVGCLNCGRLQHCYNTGYVNREFKTVTVGATSYYLPGITRNIKETGAYQSGGIVGYGSSPIIAVFDCYSAQYAGNRFGGAFGVMHKGAMKVEQIDQVSFLMNALNNTDVFYVESNAGTRTEDVSKRVRMYSPQFMRTAPSDGKLDTTYFADGTTNPGVGVFAYTFPTLTVGTGKVSHYHRTPYNPVISSYGTVKLAKHSASSTSYYITASFTLMPDEEARLKFIARMEDGSDITFFVPIYQHDFETLHRHADGNYGGDDFDYVYGYKNGMPTNPATPPDYTLEIRAYTASMATDGYDGFRYVLYFNHLTGNKSGHDSLPRDLNLLECWLYNKAAGYAANENVDYDMLQINDRIWLGNVETTGRELCFALQKDNNAATTITFSYDGGGFADQIISMKGSDWNAAAGSLNDAIDAFRNGKALRFASDSGGYDRFPYYVTGAGASRVLHVVLWYNGALLSGCEKPNGFLSTTTGVTVTISRSDTSVQHFGKLEQ